MPIDSAHSKLSIGEGIRRKGTILRNLRPFPGDVFASFFQNRNYFRGPCVWPSLLAAVWPVRGVIALPNIWSCVFSKTTQIFPNKFPTASTGPGPPDPLTRSRLCQKLGGSYVQLLETHMCNPGNDTPVNNLF